jgi:hypothetical protein
LAAMAKPSRALSARTLSPQTLFAQTLANPAASQASRRWLHGVWKM